MSVSPWGCRHCGQPERGHGDRYTYPVGGHLWVRPTLTQVKDRMLNRRGAHQFANEEESHD